MRCPALPRGPRYWRRVELVASEANGTFVATRPTRGENFETAHRGTITNKPTIWISGGHIDAYSMVRDRESVRAPSSRKQRVSGVCQEHACRWMNHWWSRPGRGRRPLRNAGPEA